VVSAPPPPPPLGLPPPPPPPPPIPFGAFAFRRTRVEAGPEQPAMGVDEAGRAAGRNLTLASIGFADVRVGAAVPGGAGYKDGLLVVGLPVPKDDGLDAAAARVVRDLATRLPDVGGAARVSNCSALVCRSRLRAWYYDLESGWMGRVMSVTVA
jgi:hypothetical protein